MGEKNKLRILVWGRGKEVYGYVCQKENFDSSKFMEEHKDNYTELSEDSIDSEIPIEYLRIMVYCNDDVVLEQCKLPDNIKLIDTQVVESYRELLGIGEKEAGAVWFHDYVNTHDATWKNVSDFDISKVSILSATRIDDTDDTKYQIFVGITYAGEDPDDFEVYGAAKSGYFGFTILD